MHACKQFRVQLPGFFGPGTPFGAVAGPGSGVALTPEAPGARSTRPRGSGLTGPRPADRLGRCVSTGGADEHPGGAAGLQAHRGSPDPATGVVENTVEAFLRAAAWAPTVWSSTSGSTADGALAVHHDPVVAGLGPIADLRVRQLPDHVPLLAAALDACGDLVVNIEVKNLPTEPGHDPAETAARMVAALVVESGLVDRVVVSSFWPGSLDAVSAVDPSVPTGLLLAGWADPAWGLEEAGEPGCRALHPHRSLVTAELVEAAHRVGLAVATWTVDGEAESAAMAGLGVDTVITDDVASAVAALAGIPSEPSRPGPHGRSPGRLTRGRVADWSKVTFFVNNAPP